MSIEELEAESGRIYDIIADIEAGEPPSLDDVQWMRRIAELAHLKNLVHELEEALLVAAEYLAEIGYPRENWHQFCAAHLEPHLSSEAIDRLKTRYRAALAGDAPKPIMVRCVDAKIQRIAGGNRQIKEETKANWRNLNPDVPESYGKKAAIGGGEKD